MRIAQIAPLWESVPPRRYGGTERIVSYLTEVLVRLGHDVTLFATGDSSTTANLESVFPLSIRSKIDPLNSSLINRDAPLVIQLEQVFGSARDFDIIHSHLDYLAFPLLRRCQTPAMTTIHGPGRLDHPEVRTVYREFSELPLVSVSNAQRSLLPWANWAGTVHHGIPKDLYSFHASPDRVEPYLVFLGRLAPDKCPDQAIELAKRAGVPLKIAAKADPSDWDYFSQFIKPRLSLPYVEYVGEVTDAEKNELLGKATGLVAPFWPEPFGLVYIEALACGTPVLAYRHGSVPELIEDGETGVLCDDFQEMVRAVPRLFHLNRTRCRQAFEERFTDDRMARDYLRIYEQVLQLATGQCIAESGPLGSGRLH